MFCRIFQVANMLYLESPVGVGYSYAKVNEHNLTYSDEVVRRYYYLI